LIRKLMPAATMASPLGACMYPGKYTDAQGHDLRNNCLVQSMRLDIPANRPGYAPDPDAGLASMELGTCLLEPPPVNATRCMPNGIGGFTWRPY
jgi:hypothetical protein